MTYIPPVNGGRINATISSNTAGAGALISTGTMALAGGNNITLSQNGGNTITIIGGAAGGSNTLGISNLGNSAGTSGVISGSALQYLLAGGNNITLSQSLNGASGTVTISAPNQSSLSATGIVSLANNGNTISIGAPAFSNGISNIGNTAGTSGTASNQVVLAGGNNVTLSQSTAAGGHTITISAANQSNQTGNIYALGNTTGQSSSSSYDLRTLSVDGGGMVSVGWSNSSLRISATQSAQTQNLHNLTLGGNSTSAGAGYIQISSGTMTLAGGNNITLSQNGNAVTISGGAGGAGPAAIYDGANSISTGTIRFTNANGVSFSINGQTISGSVLAQSNQTQGVTLGTTNGGNTSLTSTGTFDARSVYLNAHGALSAGFSASSIFLTAPPTSSLQGTGIVNISYTDSTISIGAPAFSAGISNLGNTANTSGVQTNRLVLVGGNNITLSQTHDNGSATVTIEGAAGGAGLSAGVSTGGNTLNHSGLVTGRLVFAGGNNITLSGSTNAGSATYTISAPNQSAQTQNLHNLTLAGNSTSAGAGYIQISSGTMTLAGGNNVTLSQNGNAVTVSAFNQTAQTQNLHNMTLGGNSTSAGAGYVQISSGTMTLAGGNNVTLSQNGNAVTVSAFNQTAQTQNLHNLTLAGNSTSAGAGYIQVSSGTFTLAGGNNVTLSQNGNAVTVSAFNQTVQTQNMVAVTLAGNSTSAGAGYALASSGTLTLAGGNNITLSQNGNAVTISAANGGGAGYTAGVSTGGNTLNHSGLVTGQLVFAGGNNITLSGSTNGGSATYTISTPTQTNQTGNFYVSSNSTQLSSTAAIDLRSITYMGAGGVSMGVSEGKVLASAPATSSLSATGAVSISTNGSTISIGAPGETIQSKPLGKENVYTTNSTSLGQNSLFVFPALFEGSASGSVIKMPVHVTHSTSAFAAHTRGYTARFGVYTRHATNSTVLTQMYSTSYTAGFFASTNRTQSHSIITGLGNSTSYNTTTFTDNTHNLSSLIHGSRELLIAFASHVTPGEYWLAFANSSSSGGAAGNLFNLSFVVNATNTSAFNALGVSANTTQGMFRHMGLGSYSATTGGIPNGISMTQINPLSYFPMMYFHNSTS